MLFMFATSKSWWLLFCLGACFAGLCVGGLVISLAFVIRLCCLLLLVSGLWFGLCLLFVGSVTVGLRVVWVILFGDCVVVLFCSLRCYIW